MQLEKVRVAQQRKGCRSVPTSAQGLQRGRGTAIHSPSDHRCDRSVRREGAGQPRFTFSTSHTARLMRASFHKANSPALFHSVESLDNFISIEDCDEPVHCTRRVAWAWRNVFSENAPGILNSMQYRVLIRGVHGTRLTEADSIRSPSCLFLIGGRGGRPPRSFHHHI